MKKYSLGEIDEMRKLVELITGKETGLKPSQLGQAQIEDRLRTYMAGGVTVGDLKDKYVGLDTIYGAGGMFVQSFQGKPTQA